MKPKIEWHIERLMDAFWENWDGPFKTERLARKKFDTVYRIEGGAKAQLFRVVKTTVEPVPFMQMTQRQGRVRRQKVRS